MEAIIKLIILIAVAFAGAFINNWFANRDKTKNRRILLLEDKLHKIYAPLLINISLLHSETKAWRKSQKTEEEKSKNTAEPFIEKLRSTAITSCIQNMLSLRDKNLSLLSNNYGFLDTYDEEIFLQYIKTSEAWRPILINNAYVTLVDEDRENPKHPMDEEEELLQNLELKLKNKISNIKTELENLK